ncbi:hypothetical protein YQE_07169, partial [Dendroctonus ponderosae]
PRIDPLQLLKCLSVLLSPDGGILSRDEVPRLVNLMTKFSKKLVSKCVYVLIMKNTETSLVDMFMAEGGWALIQNWLQDAVQTGNWDLVKEILGLLLITPVDVERLKMNCLPKVIKSLSRREDLPEVANISNQIVQNWLTIVKGCSGMTTSNGPIRVSPAHSDNRVPAQNGEEFNKKPDVAVDAPEPAVSVPVEERNGEVNKTSLENVEPIGTTTFYKMSMKDGKQVIKKVTPEDSKNVSEDDESIKSDDNKIKPVEKDAKSSDKEKSSRSASSSSKSKSSSSSRDKDRDKKGSSKSSSSSKSKSSSSSSRDKDRKDRDKDRDRKDRSKNSRSSSRSNSKSSSSKDKKDSIEKSKEPKEVKENQADKDKDTLDKVKPQTLDKLGRIPKKSNGSDEKQKENKTSEESDKKKPSFSILNRKGTGEERSKTVKVFNAKMRSTGLEEEVKPPPPRSANKKPNLSVQLPTIPPKRPSPPREFSSSVPPEKKLRIEKVDIPDRPGAIKLIPPKPKPAILQESDMFMDALTASAPKKDAKKRKRRVSVSKETVPSSPSASPAQGDGQAADSATPTSPPIGLKNLAPINFYQDTLSKEPVAAEETAEATESDSVEAGAEPSEPKETPSSPPNGTESEAMEVDEAPNAPRPTKQEGGLKGVLLFAKKKGPKRSIKWKAEDDLVEVRYFELDENERVNVTKTFMDMAKMEMTSEREALIMSRKLPNEDTMEPQTMWRMLFMCDQPESLAIPGSKSLEKDIQFAREKTVLAALYFDKRRIPDSAEEPIPEIHQMSDPVSIPLEDPECQEIDLRNTPWPEPKGLSPQMEPQIVPPIFQNMPFNPNFNTMGNIPPGAPFMGVPPRFQGPPGPMGPVPGNFVPPNMMHNNMMVPPMNQPDMMNSIPPGAMNQGLFGPGGMMKPGPDGFIGHGNAMPSFNGPQGPMFGPNNFNRGRGGFRRGGSNNGGWVQLNGPRAWKRGSSGSSRGGGRLCKNIQNHGYCRNGDSCPFVH